MGILRDLFGSKHKDDEKTDIFDQMMKVSARAKVSRDGFPLCPACGTRFPVLAETMKKESGGRPVFDCGQCGKRLRL